MTKLLERAVEAVRRLPPEAQDELARVILRFAGDDGLVVQLTDDERAALARSKTAAQHGDFASDEQVRAAWAKRGV